MGESRLARFGDHRGWARAAVIAAAVVIAAHGLVHLMGVGLLWKLGEPGQRAASLDGALMTVRHLATGNEAAA